jgi:hypothetical protein
MDNWEMDVQIPNDLKSLSVCQVRQAYASVFPTLFLSEQIF